VSDLSRDEFIAHVSPMREDIAELVRLQREANGRLAKAEARIAVLEDRSPGRAGMLAGGVMAGAVAVLLRLMGLFGDTR